MKTVVVERSFEQPLTEEQVDGIREGSSACFEAHRVRFVRSLVSADRKRTVCVFEAPDAESVRQANHKAGLPFDRVWPAEDIVAL
jgi:hypothetical protein